MASNLIEEFGGLAVGPLEEAGVKLTIPRLMEIMTLRAYSRARDKVAQSGDHATKEQKDWVLAVQKARMIQESQGRG